jgi:hypothetical protein
MNTEEFDEMIGDEEVFAGLRRSVAGASLATSAADVAAFGRRTRNRHRALAAGIGTSAAALVAAIGVLAPSAGTGAGGAPNAQAQGTKVSQSAVTLDIQEAGFTLRKHADGVVDLTMSDVFDPAKLRAALDKAGIKNDFQEVKMPADWVDKTPVDCAATPGVERDEKAITEGLENVPNVSRADVPPEPGSQGQAIKSLPTDGRSPVLYEFRPGQFPATDVVALVRLDYGDSAKERAPMLDILTGMPGTCVPVPAGSSQATKSRF